MGKVKEIQREISNELKYHADLLKAYGNQIQDVRPMKVMQNAKGTNKSSLKSEYERHMHLNVNGCHVRGASVGELGTMN
jgi:hypothetical protein